MDGHGLKKFVDETKRYVEAPKKRRLPTENQLKDIQNPDTFEILEVSFSYLVLEGVMVFC